MKPVTPTPIEKEKINKDFKFCLGILKLKKGNKQITTTNILNDPKAKGVHPCLRQVFQKQRHFQIVPWLTKLISNV